MIEFPNRRKPAADRFWAKVEKGGADDCWLWTARKLPTGYGHFMVGRSADGCWRPTLAHVFSWIMATGQRPNGLFVCHKCDVPACVNPRHLFLGTDRDNKNDMLRKGRHARGEKKTKTAKLKNTDVLEIRRLRAAGLSHTKIATRFPVSRGAISKILRGEAWSHVGATLALFAVLSLFNPHKTIAETTLASFYGGGERLSRHTANGERFTAHARTCAHRNLPFGTQVRVTNIRTGRSVICRVTDRGPAKWTGRSIDLARGAAEAIGMVKQGVAHVRMEVVQ